MNFNSSDNLVGIRVALWDVRAQWESGLRTLTVAQSCLEKWHVMPGDEREALLATLHEQINALRDVNLAVRGLLADVTEAVHGDALTAPSSE